MDIARPAGADGVLDGRGVAVADFDGDGRLDLAINNNNSRPTIYSNRLAAGHWLRFELVGAASNRDAVGARVQLTFRTAGTPGGGRSRTLTRWVEAGSGYASQSAFPVHFGLGDATRVEAVEITWPSGATARIDGSDLEIDQTVRVEESGAVLAAAVAVRSPRRIRAGG